MITPSFSVWLRNRTALLFTVVFACLVTAAPNSALSGPHIVVDAETGQILSGKDSQRRWAPASMTKLMTTYATFHAIKSQQISMASPVTISKKASRQPPSKMGFAPGTVMTVDQAIKIIMVKSANDVAHAIAESVSGSEEAFVSLMNSHARKLGMTGTQFRNPHGLPNKAQYTTALDMAKLGIAVQKEFPQYASYLKIPGLVHGKRRLRNFNRLLTRYRGTTGMKTGFICASGYNVITSAERKTAYGKKRKLVAVVMGQTSGRRRNAVTAQLLQRGFGRAEDYGQHTVFDVPVDSAVYKAPADITDQICRRKKRRSKAKRASLASLEKAYMQKPFDAGPYQRIVLGNADGPNPFAARFHISQKNSGAIAIPTRKPGYACYAVPLDLPAERELPKLAALDIEPELKKQKKNSRKKKRSAKEEVKFPQPDGCIPVPMARNSISVETETMLVASADAPSSEKMKVAVLEDGEDLSKSALPLSSFVEEEKEPEITKPFSLALNEPTAKSRSISLKQNPVLGTATSAVQSPEIPTTPIVAEPKPAEEAITTSVSEASPVAKNSQPIAETVVPEVSDASPQNPETAAEATTEKNAERLEPETTTPQVEVAKDESGAATAETEFAEIKKADATETETVSADSNETIKSVVDITDKTEQTAAVQDETIVVAVASPDTINIVEPENTSVASEEEATTADLEADKQIILASLNISDLIIPTKRPIAEPSLKPETQKTEAKASPKKAADKSKKAEKPEPKQKAVKKNEKPKSKTAAAKTSKKSKSAKSSKDPISAERNQSVKRTRSNPALAGMCRVYRNSGCFTGKAKESGRCKALKNAYRQNRRLGLNCGFG